MTVVARDTRTVWDKLWSGRQQATDFYPATSAFVRHVRERLTPGCRVLEVGPGTGRDAAEMARDCGLVVAVDRSAESLSLIRRSGLEVERLRLVQGDGLRVPFVDGSFDVVCHQGLLEHFRDPRPLLRDNHRLLRPGGYLVVDVPQTFHAWTILKQACIAVNRWFAGWETQYTPRQLRRVVTAAGFEIVETYADWMRPSLWYRSAHALGTRVGMPIPQEPPWRASSSLGDWWLRQGAGHWTGCTVGVVAKKACGSDAAVTD